MFLLVGSFVFAYCSKLRGLCTLNTSCGILVSPRVCVSNGGRISYISSDYKGAYVYVMGMVVCVAVEE